MPSHSERTSSFSLSLAPDEPSLKNIDPSSSQPMASSPIMPSSSEDHGEICNSAASLDSLVSTTESSTSSPMSSSPVIAPSSPIEPPSPRFQAEHRLNGTQENQRILILGATGNQGRGCLRALLSSQHRDKYTIGIVVRDLESASAAALSNSIMPGQSQSQSLSKCLSSLDIHILSGDYSSPSSLSAAFEIFQPTTVFFPPVLTDDFRRDLVWSQNVISAAAHCGSVTKMIASTALGVDRRAEFPGWGKNGEWHPMSSYWNTKASIEELVEGAEFESWTIVRPAWFLHSLTQRMVGWSYLGWKDTDEVRTIRTKWKRNTKVAWVDAEDVGVVATRVVDDETQGERKKWRNKGVDLAVEAITVGELAEKMGKVLGEEVRVWYADEPSTWTDEEEQDWATGRTVSDMDPIAISQRWANEFDSSYGVAATRELGLLGQLTTVDEFLERNRNLI
ncbi:hypothetical protein SMACR_08597 [Sordaria macrospora]|uniref:WGS project CABT00000000 data, contig 2.60 n=3 Tax=Sordaria macrospora TaxID=5147 RepID=F7WAB9_SORMK|nr:uncharacterized protein SMAC_08597 [Sordaria macrospora k-hell]KAA8632610.1 hypothetical protein SMACR_08597 [Sordaria macrospora]KAH7627782.1 hypothetical protein B0T09DRAFT_359112 [Sordaria sp. MPI-SDFR-AT-0083]CCC14154.1 unnamed protein product [Sordaria macrospora k-hell]